MAPGWHVQISIVREFPRQLSMPKVGRNIVSARGAWPGRFCGRALTKTDPLVRPCAEREREGEGRKQSGCRR